MIFYYTATGNSLYVAKNVEENPLSIPQELKKDLLHYKDEKIGIIAPIYAGELPKTVRRFIKKATFQTDYFYLLLTYGNNNSVAGVWSENFCKENGINVDYVQTIKMVDNYLPAFDMEEQMAINKKVDEQLKSVLDNLDKRTRFIPQPTPEGKDAYAMVSKRFSKHPELNNGQSIIMKDQCVGCKICEQVCPVGNIKVEDKKAKRINDTCDFCLACVHHCPFQAIGLTLDKNPDARYRHLKIKLKEIIQSNHQGGTYL